MQQILLIGDGQLGQELRSRLVPWKAVTVERDRLELTQPDSIRQVIRQIQPHLVINTAAYTAVDQAEREREQAHQVNGLAPGILAEEVQRLGAKLIHLSTDYVFDGQNNSPYTEADVPNPLNVYGQSKLTGEQAIQQVAGCCHIIFRTAWLHSSHGNNFVKTMLRLGAQREEIRVVRDQIGSPTWAGDLAKAIVQFIPHLGPETTGIYHYTNSGVASWSEFAIAIFAIARQLGFPLQVRRVLPITSAEYPALARRPAYSALDCAKIAAVLGPPPPWQQGLRQMLIEYRHTYESTDPLRR